MARTAGPPNPPPVRVAHVVEALEVGGLERLLVEFARHADRSRFALQVVTLGRRGHLAAEVEALGWPVFEMDARPGLKPSAVVRLARHFVRERVGVVHTHSEGPLLYAAPAARVARVRRVIHTRHHGPDLGNPRRVLALVAAASRLVDRYACVAGDGARRCVEEGVPASRVVTVWNGIDLGRFAYKGPAPDGPAVVVGRLAPEKDHATLLRASALVARSDPAFRLDVAGDGPCEGDLRALAASLGLGRVVRFLGRVGDVAGLLAGAGVLVLPSRMEGVSLTLLEGMARGLPVVATRVGGTPEVVVDGETGRLVPPGSPEALAEALLAYRCDPDGARRDGLAGRERAERFFDVRRTVARYERLYLDGERTTRSASGAEAGVP